MESGLSNAAIRELFELHGLRCTKQRERMYAALAATKSHPTAEDLYTAVRLSEPGMSLATVYNTLEAFTEVGLARRLANTAGASRYDADIRDHVHVALADGRLIDVPQDLSERLLAGLPESVLHDLERRLGVRVGGVSIQVVAADAARRNGAD